MPIEYSDPPLQLMRRTQALLDSDDRSLAEIFKQSGLPFYWLKKFKAGRIKQPSVNRIQKLYEFLTQSKLAVK